MRKVFFIILYEYYKNKHKNIEINKNKAIKNKNDRNKALDLLINKLIEQAKELKFKVIFTSVEHKKLLERYKDHGFVETDKSMTNMIKRL